MSNILKESGFLTIDLDALAKKQKETNTENSSDTNDTKPSSTTVAPDSAQTDNGETEAGEVDATDERKPEEETDIINKVIFDPKTEVPKNFDWKIARTKILKDNAKNPESKKPESELLNQFWSAYLNKVYGQELAELMSNLGDQFKQDFTEYGFESKANPLATFFKLSFVKKLLKTKKLNSARYKAIHEAFDKKLVADSEFLKQNSYNILYCGDLYNKSASDMVLYLKAQKSILSPSASTYGKDLLNRNRRIFIQLPGGPKNKNLADKATVTAIIKHQQQNSNLPTKTLENVILNSLELVNILMKSYKLTADFDEAEEGAADESSQRSSTVFNNNTITKIQQEAKKAKTLAPVGAALFYLSKAGNAQATKALNSSKYSAITLADLNKYSRGLGLDRIKIDAAKIDTFVTKLINITV